jgi:hypothetical protein
MIDHHQSHYYFYPHVMMLMMPQISNSSTTDCAMTMLDLLYYSQHQCHYQSWTPFPRQNVTSVNVHLAQPRFPPRSLQNMHADDYYYSDGCLTFSRHTRLLILPTRITGGLLVDLCMDISSSLLVGDNVGDDAAR